jgi:arginine/lysine/ornithine decarboxylase
LVIDCCGLSGFAVKAELEREGVFPEMANNSAVVFITTPFNADRITDIVDALHKIEVSIPAGDEVPIIKHRRAKATGTIEFVRLEESIGRIAVNEIGLYPPGTPIIISGDIIDQQTIDLLNANRNYIIGLVKGLVPVLK